MAKYRCSGHVSGSKYLGVVEAANEEAAIEAAYDLPSAYVSLCHQCSGHCEDPEIVAVNVELIDDEEEG